MGLHAISAYAARNLQKTQPDKASAWHDAYGIWFAGSLRTSVEAKHGRLSWVFLDTDPKKLDEGEHAVDVWGKSGTLVFWKSQGYLRGAIVLTEEEPVLDAARSIALLKPWSFEPIRHLGNRP